MIDCLLVCCQSVICLLLHCLCLLLVSRSSQRSVVDSLIHPSIHRSIDRSIAWLDETSEGCVKGHDRRTYTHPQIHVQPGLSRLVVSNSHGVISDVSCGVAGRWGPSVIRPSVRTRCLFLLFLLVRQASQPGRCTYVCHIGSACLPPCLQCACLLPCCLPARQLVFVCVLCLSVCISLRSSFVWLPDQPAHCTPAHIRTVREHIQTYIVGD
mmetsp:Transcript_22971/g.56778  ORF Transcript_22971/g.56778 Transcript_22971/m.56778 type:complete len:211 (-) Transcript_22971:705-1337(-)